MVAFRLLTSHLNPNPFPLLLLQRPLHVCGSPGGSAGIWCLGLVLRTVVRRIDRIPRFGHVTAQCSFTRYLALAPSPAPDHLPDLWVGFIAVSRGHPCLPTQDPLLVHPLRPAPSFSSLFQADCGPRGVHPMRDMKQKSSLFPC